MLEFDIVLKAMGKAKYLFGNPTQEERYKIIEDINTIRRHLRIGCMCLSNADSVLRSLGKQLSE